MSDVQPNPLATLSTQPLLLVSASGEVLFCNSAARRLLGTQIGHSLQHLSPNGQIPGFLSTCRGQSQPVTGRLQLRTPDGEQEMAVHAATLDSGGDPTVALVLSAGEGASDVPPVQAAPPATVVSHLEAMQHIAGVLASSSTGAEDDILEAAAHAVRQRLGADAVMVWLLAPDGSQLTLTTHVGVSEDSLRPVATVPHDHIWPVSSVLASHQIEVLEGTNEELQNRLPAARQASLSYERYAVAPLIAGQREVGAMVLAYHEPTELDRGQRLFLSTVSLLCAGAVDQMRLNGQLQRQHERASFRAEAGRLLGSSLDYEATLRRVADLAGPATADACVVALASPDGHLYPVAASHHDPRHQVTVDRLVARNERLGNPYLLNVMETGEPLVVDWISADDLGELAEGQEQRRLLDSLGATAAIAVPIECVLERRGLLLVVSTSTPPTLSKADLSFVEDLADHAALAIANAESHRRVDKLAAELAEALDSRVVIEQAKGVLAERHQEHPEEAFKRLHSEARSSQQRIHRLAEDVVAGRVRI